MSGLLSLSPPSVALLVPTPYCCSAGVDPAHMGIGPCPAIRIALKKANLNLDQMALVEINEAFAAQYLSCEKELGLNRCVLP